VMQKPGIPSSIGIQDYIKKHSFSMSIC
jgi:hypothetical protein